MTDSNTDTVLRRKLAQSGGSNSSGDLAMLRALRLGVARVARQQIGLRVDVIGATLDLCPGEALRDVLGSQNLLAVLDGEAGVSGAVALGPDLVRGLVQQQAIGSLLDPETDGQARAYTDTDTALCAPLVEAMLGQAADLLDSREAALSLSGHRIGRRMKDGQEVAIAVDGVRFRVIDLTLDISEGWAQSRLVLILPERQEKADPDPQPAQSSPMTLGDVAWRVPVRLNAVMCRVPMMWSDLAGMKPGDILPLPPYRADRTELLTMSGCRAGWGRLGKVDGLRAIRVNETSQPDAEFAQAPDAHVSDDPGGDIGVSAMPVSLTSPAGSTDGTGIETEDLNLDTMDQDAALRRITELAGLEDEVIDPVLDPAD